MRIVDRFKQIRAADKVLSDKLSSKIGNITITIEEDSWNEGNIIIRISDTSHRITIPIEDVKKVISELDRLMNMEDDAGKLI